jgi:ABC-type proline/glycine betaine transport system ATPase subunit
MYLCAIDTAFTRAYSLSAAICDYDRVLVLSSGTVVEFASPASLLRDPASAFSSMVDETGEANAALLRGIAYGAEARSAKSAAEAAHVAEARGGYTRPSLAINLRDIDLAH